MNYADAVRSLYRLRLFGLKFGLENTVKLAALALDPQKQLRFIHVAGTNGKGSTCAMLESIYRQAGLRVGLYTSPHLVSFRERMQVNRRLIDEASVVRLVEEMQPWLGQFPAEQHPTFFEVVTVMALRYFAEEKTDLVIWETGMGGRLDATNIVTPLASVITNVQLDHQRWLGNTLGEIAREKAGIIKPDVPVLTTAEEPEALAVITAIARERHAPLRVVGTSAGEIPLDSLALPLPGEHQRKNAALALAVTQALQQVIPVPTDAVRRGLETVDWPGRFQVVRAANGRTLVLDGAHNPAGAEALRAGWRRHFPGKAPVLILGVLEDKDWPQMCATLSPLARRVLLVPVKSDRTAAAAELTAACMKANPAIDASACASLEDALNQSANDPFVVVTGSLYLVGEALELLSLERTAGPDERGLNEWSQSK